MFKRAILLTAIFLLATCSLTLAQPAQLWETGQTTCYDYFRGSQIPVPGPGRTGRLRPGWPGPIPVLPFPGTASPTT